MGKDKKRKVVDEVRLEQRAGEWARSIYVYNAASPWRDLYVFGAGRDLVSSCDVFTSKSLLAWCMHVVGGGRLAQRTSAPSHTPPPNPPGLLQHRPVKRRQSHTT